MAIQFNPTGPGGGAAEVATSVKNADDKYKKGVNGTADGINDALGSSTRTSKDPAGYTDERRDTEVSHGGSPIEMLGEALYGPWVGKETGYRKVDTSA
jgi:hypothetical protein